MTGPWSELLKLIFQLIFDLVKVFGIEHGFGSWWSMLNQRINALRGSIKEGRGTLYVGVFMHLGRGITSQLAFSRTAHMLRQCDRQVRPLSRQM